jgi:hypothetical protein
VLEHPPSTVGHPVTGGVKTPVIPMRGFLQLFFATGISVTIPGRFGWSRTFTTPLAPDAFVVSFSEAPLILMRIPFTDLPFWLTFIESTVVRPTKSVFGDTATAVQNTVGGTNGPFTTTEADAVLFAVFVSASVATVVPVFVTVPGAFAFVPRRSGSRAGS